MSNSEKNEVKKTNKKNSNNKKSSNNKKNVTSKKKKVDNKLFNFINNNRFKLVFGLLLLIDIIMIICFAKDNYANYAVVEGKSIFIGKTRNLLFGRNYVGLIVTFFIYIYGIIVNKYFFKKKINIKILVLILLGLLLFNMLLFYLFTNKIY